MPEEKTGFRILMDRIRGGSEDAVRELIEVYGPHIFRVVRRNLQKRMRVKFDSCDFVQDVWTSVIRDANFGKEIDSPEELVTYLATMARNKVIDAIRQRCGTDKFDVNREKSLEGSAAIVVGAISGTQPSPSQILIADEEFEKMLSRLSPEQQTILASLRAGNSRADAARAAGVDEKMVRRTVAKATTEV